MSARSATTTVGHALSQGHVAHAMMGSEKEGTDVLIATRTNSSRLTHALHALLSTMAAVVAGKMTPQLA